MSAAESTALATIERDFNGLTVQFIEREDGSLWMTREQLADCLGFSDPEAIRKMEQRHDDEIRPFKGRLKVTRPLGGPQDVVVYEERGLYLLGCFAKTEPAAKFREFMVNVAKDMRTRDKVLVDAKEYESQRELLVNLLHAYEAQAGVNARMASLAGSVLSLRRLSKPKTDPRQLVFGREWFHEPADEKSHDSGDAAQKETA